MAVAQRSTPSSDVWQPAAPFGWFKYRFKIDVACKLQRLVGPWHGSLPGGILLLLQQPCWQLA